jgi:hypothetical protein
VQRELMEVRAVAGQLSEKLNVEAANEYENKLRRSEALARFCI